MPQRTPRSPGLLAATLATVLMIGAGPAGAASFNLYYDDFDNGVIEFGNIVGMGTFSYDGPISEGEFLLSDLTGVSFEADFAGALGVATFSGPPFDPADDTLIGISVTEPIPGVFEMVFTGEFADTGGSLDIDISSGILSHEPEVLLASATGPRLYFADDADADFDYFGEYIGTTATLIPVPPALYLFGSALAALWLRRRPA